MSRDEGVLIENVGAASAAKSAQSESICSCNSAGSCGWLKCALQGSRSELLLEASWSHCVPSFLDALNEGRSIVRHVQLRVGRCKHQEMKADFGAFELLVLNGTAREQEDHNVDADQHEGDDGPSPPAHVFVTQWNEHKISLWSRFPQKGAKDTLQGRRKNPCRDAGRKGR